MPVEIVYDQDRVLAVSENSGDIIYTEGFQNYIDTMKYKVRLCRGFDPQSKGKVGAVVKYAKYNFAINRIFTDIDSFNEASFKWLDRTGNGKKHEITKKYRQKCLLSKRNTCYQYLNSSKKIHLRLV